jgi:hypothetical protein
MILPIDEFQAQATLKLPDITLYESRNNTSHSYGRKWSRFPDAYLTNPYGSFSKERREVEVYDQFVRIQIPSPQS